MAATALVVVDIQNDFLPGGALAVPRGDEVVSVANRWMEDVDLVVATQDWHPADHLSFAANHPGHAIGDTVDLSGLEQVLWPVHCVQDSSGAEFARGLRVSRFDRVFRKGTDRQIDSYSGFFDNDHRHGTGLAEFLQRREVNRLIILGLATDYCVKYTALDARRLGFATSVVAEGCRGVELQPGDTEAAYRQMRAAGVDVRKGGESIFSGKQGKLE